jgi:hypothetical protein
VPRSLPRTEVYDSYWHFAAERLAIYYRRLENPIGPWTANKILQEYRFTNTFRAADRVSQYLIREVQYGEDRSQSAPEVFYRTMLFKLFNRIETWEAIERELGHITWATTGAHRVSAILDRLLSKGRRIYSAAYIMPSPKFGHVRKHANHLSMLDTMMKDGLAARLEAVKDMEAAYKLLLSYPGLGPFLAFQYTVDLNYSTLLNFDEDQFVVAGPGALDGIAKCFNARHVAEPSDVIQYMVENQEEEFQRLGLRFKGLFGRRLKLIDCQNLFCEVSKYARVAHPDVDGASGRTRIKQRYRPVDSSEAVAPAFPPKWKLNPKVQIAKRPTQLSLLPSVY